MEIVKHPVMDSLVIRGPRARRETADFNGLASDLMDALAVIVRGVFVAANPAAGPLTRLQAPDSDNHMRWKIADQDIPRDDVPVNPDPFKTESDLAIFKPRMDIVLLSEAPSPEDSTLDFIGEWRMKVELNGVSMTATANKPELYAFGWEPRTGGTREGHADGAFDPATDTLPAAFNNLFFNGGRYDGAGPKFTYPPSSTGTVNALGEADYGNAATSVIEETPQNPFSFALPGFTPTATITYRLTPARDAPVRDDPIAMNLDTVVYDETPKRYYAVWRGNWDYARVPEERYVRLVIA